MQLVRESSPTSMADFPPNLDDGEFWLPSNIFRDVGGVSRHSHRQNSPPSFLVDELLSAKPPPSFGFAYIDDLACQLAAIGLLDQDYMLQSPPAAFAPAFHALNPSPKQSSNLQGLKGGRPPFAFEPPPIAVSPYDGFLSPAMVMSAGDGGFGTFPCGLAKPVHGRHAQVQQRLPKPFGRRYVPVRFDVGSGRECEGTGVFLPRVSNAPGGNNTCKSIGQTRKKSLGKEESSSNVNTQGTQWVCGSGSKARHSTAQLRCGLPQDWTY